MTKKYIAIGSVGRFQPGEEIKGLDAERIQALLASGAIAEYKEPEEPKGDDSAVEIAELKAELKEALGKASQAEAQNIAYVKEIEALKAEIAELKKVPEIAITQTDGLSVADADASVVADAVKSSKAKAK